MALAEGDVNIFWYLPPILVAISLVYSATRFETWPYILSYTARWSVYIFSFLAVSWIFLWLLGTGQYWSVPIALGGLAYFLFWPSGSKKKDPAEAEPANSSKS